LLADGGDLVGEAGREFEFLCLCGFLCRLRGRFVVVGLDGQFFLLRSLAGRVLGVGAEPTNLATLFFGSAFGVEGDQTFENFFVGQSDRPVVLLRLKVPSYARNNFIKGLRVVFAASCPRSTGMKYIPRRTLTAVSTFAGIVISESIQRLIPDQRELVDQQQLSQRDPNVVDDKPPTRKIREGKISNLGNRLCVFEQAAIQHVPGRRVYVVASLPRSRRDCLPNTKPLHDSYALPDDRQRSDTYHMTSTCGEAERRTIALASLNVSDAPR
jgi:hypothetical protein